MIVTTMNDIPGYAVDEVFGEVTGLTVRSRNIGSQIGAGLKSIVGGELFLSHTKLRDRYVLRLAIGNARTTEDDVRQAWDVLNREAER